MSPRESGQRNYFSIYHAFVVDNNDPLKIGRVKLRVPEVLGPTVVTGWAPCKSMPYGGGQDAGMLFVPENGQGVYVEFMAGDVNRPIYSGAWFATEGEIDSDIPDIAKGKPFGERDLSRQNPKETIEATVRAPQPRVKAAGASIGQKFAVDQNNNVTENPVSPFLVAEPPDPYDAEYPKNKIIRTRGGVLVELDSTDGKERINLHHPSGSYDEVAPDGSRTVKSSNKTDIALNRSIIIVQGSRYGSIEGDDFLSVGGARNLFGSQGLVDEVLRSRELITGNNFTNFVGGSFAETIEGNRHCFVDGRGQWRYVGDISEFCGGRKVGTYNTGYREMIGTSNRGVPITPVFIPVLSENIARESTIIFGDSVDSIGVGNYFQQLLSGNHTTNILAGLYSVQSLVGGMSFETGAGNMSFETGAGNMDLQTGAGNLTLETGVGNLTAQASVGNSLFGSVAGNASLQGIDVSVTGASSVSLNTPGSLTLSGSTINFGSLTSPVGQIIAGVAAIALPVLTERFLLHFDSHTHLSGPPGSPTTPPVIPSTPLAPTFSTAIFKAS